MRGGIPVVGIAGVEVDELWEDIMRSVLYSSRPTGCSLVIPGILYVALSHGE